MDQVTIHWVKSFGEGEVYSTIVFRKESLVICRLIEKITYRKKKLSKNIDQALTSLLIKRGDLGFCDEIPYSRIKNINKKILNDKIVLIIELKDDKPLFFYISYKKKELLKKGLNLFKKHN